MISYSLSPESTLSLALSGPRYSRLVTGAYVPCFRHLLVRSWGVRQVGDMYFELLGDIKEIKTFASGRGLRELARLRKTYGASGPDNQPSSIGSVADRRDWESPRRSDPTCAEPATGVGGSACALIDRLLALTEARKGKKGQAGKSEATA